MPYCFAPSVVAIDSSREDSVLALQFVRSEHSLVVHLHLGMEDQTNSHNFVN